MPFAIDAPDLQLPLVDARNQPYWDAAREGRLLLARCQDCRRLLVAPVQNCHHCLGERFAWEAARGIGTIYSFIEYHRAWNKEMEALVPYTVVLAALDEGPFMFGGLIEHPAQAGPHVGDAVRVVFQRRAQGWRVPMFELAASSSTGAQ